MKLTVDQMFLIQEACTLRAEQLLERSHLAATSKDATSADYWKQEAAAAHQLSLLFKDAIKVEITTAALEPATPTSQEAALAVQRRYQTRLAEMLKPLRQRAAATHLPAANQAPAAVSDAPSTEPASAVQATVPLHSAADKATSDPQASVHATHDSWTSADTSHQSAHGTTPHAHETIQVSALPGIHSPVSAQAVQPQSHGSAQPKMHSSAHPAEACGDIN